MAKKALILKSKKEPKHSTKAYNRCSICGRPHGYIRDFGICRLCFRKLAHTGEIPGIKKSSW
ncbi:MAG TPA: type Z 30S ribosomal protein S14 [Chloroflexi bacterium]|jgi:small subunit ribosomal protein S14|nr:type Z 30S ribosomal protein S14 [Candidatus Bipolaricaulota bacterium]RLD07199.1 MAG: type Z 30S ribosomal protein S14 [Chloroflexota bacterium]HDD25347.1 type Z 30S ribosomal protein S14 [Chloroflexota bacterium]